ncbi:hypothetical protein HanPI659440_Chr02g0047011 [Helianthus annuus]|nr:hypothetical protein HanPI659440_Chr02g0047011 [Helianthus annuus]
MAELSNQQPRSVAGGTATFIDHPGSPLNVVPHNLLMVLHLMKMKMHLVRVELLKILNLFLQSFQQSKFSGLKMRTWTILVSPDAYEYLCKLRFSCLDFHWILLDFFLFLFFLCLASDLNQNGINDDEDGVQNCTFTELLSRGQFLSESMNFVLEGYCNTPSYNVCSLLLECLFCGRGGKKKQMMWWFVW